MRVDKHLLFLFLVFMFFPVSLTGFTVYKAIGVILSVLGVISLTARKRAAPILNRFFWALVVLCIAGIIGGVAFGHVNWDGVSRMLMSIVLFVIIAQIVESVADFRLVLGGIATGGLVTVLSGLAEIPGMEAGERLAGAMANPNGFGQVCVQTGICLLGLYLTGRGRFLRRLTFVLTALCVVGLLYSASRGATTAFVASLLAMLSLRATRRTALAAIVVAGLAVMLVMPQQLFDRWATAFHPRRAGRQSALEQRIDLSKNGWVLFKRSPLVGVGVGNTVNALRVIKSRYTIVTHNAFAQVLGETGTLGTSAFLLMLWWTMRGLSRAARSRGPETSSRTLSGLLMVLFVAVTVSQMSSGNYAHAIWYVLFATGMKAVELARAEAPAALAAELAYRPPGRVEPAGRTRGPW